MNVIEWLRSWVGVIFLLSGYAGIPGMFLFESVYFFHILTILSILFFRKENYVALKVVKSAQHFNETAIDEIRILKKVQDEDENDPYKNRIVSLLNHFSIRGVNGIHTCLVFEALGVSLYKLIVRNNYKGLSLPQIKVIMKQVSVM